MFNRDGATHHYSVKLDGSYKELGWDLDRFTEALIAYCDNGNANFGGHAFYADNGFWEVAVYAD
jgi:hypothetical protein